VLHNILIDLRDEFEYAEVDEVDDDDAISNQPTPQATVFQDAVRDRWLRDVAGWSVQ
jgi:hypothetical protein